MSSGQTRMEADFLEEALNLKAGQRVLDVACGFGRHSIELARRGYRMTGLDVSAEMIREAKKRASEEKCRVEWRNAEMRRIGSASKFDGAFCFGNSFGFLDRAGTGKFLAAMSKALKPGSRFAFDYGTAAESILPRYAEREWSPVDDLYFLESNRYDVAESCIETTFIFLRNGSADTRIGYQWVYTVREIRQMLDEAGLKTVSLFQSLDRRPYDLGSPLLIVVAAKR